LDDDLIILYYAGNVRDALSADPDDPLTGDQWVGAMASALGDLFTACVDAGYITRPAD
jgi:hypothetical protein